MRCRNLCWLPCLRRLSGLLPRLARTSYDPRACSTASRVAHHPEGHSDSLGFWLRPCRVAPRSRCPASLRRKGAPRGGRPISTSPCNHGRLSPNREEYSPHRVLLPSGLCDVFGLEGSRRSGRPRMSSRLRCVPSPGSHANRRPRTGGNGSRLERTSARRLALHSVERLDTHPGGNLAHLPSPPRDPARPVKKNA